MNDDNSDSDSDIASDEEEQEDEETESPSENLSEKAKTDNSLNKESEPNVNNQGSTQSTESDELSHENFDIHSIAHKIYYKVSRTKIYF